MTKMRISIHMLLIMMTAFSSYTEALSVGNTHEKQSIFNLLTQSVDHSENIETDESDFDQDSVVNGHMLVNDVVSSEVSVLCVIEFSSFSATLKHIRAPPNS